MRKELYEKMLDFLEYEESYAKKKGIPLKKEDLFQNWWKENKVYCEKEKINFINAREIWKSVWEVLFP